MDFFGALFYPWYILHGFITKKQADSWFHEKKDFR